MTARDKLGGWLRIAAVLAMVGAGACNRGGEATYLLVTVERGTPGETVDQLAVTLLLGGREAHSTFGDGQGELTLPSRLPFAIGSGEGEIRVSVQAMHGGRAVAEGSAIGSIARNRVNRLTVVLGTTGWGDGGSDGPGVPDAGPGDGPAAERQLPDATLDRPSDLPPDAPGRDGPADAPGRDGSADRLADVAGSSLNVVPKESDFGSLTVGSESQAVSFTVKNTGDTATGTLTLALSDTANFAVTSNACTGTVAADASCVVSVKFTPQNPAGGKQATLAFSAMPGGSPSVLLKGVCLSQGALKLDPTNAGFAALPLGHTSPEQYFTVTNSGDSSTGLPSVRLSDSSHFVIASNTCTQALAPRAGCRVGIRFAPAKLGEWPVVLSVSAAPGGTATASLSGVATLLVTVLKQGNGAGTVTSVPAGLECGASCSAPFSSETVRLVASPDPNSRLAGWSGGGCGGTGDCNLLLTSPTTVTATFEPRELRIAVSKTGTGSGSVVWSASPGQLDCGPDCSENVAPGTLVTLNATADPSSDFAGWSGACGGTGPCTVTVNADTEVTADFARKSVPLTVLKAGTGQGTVGSSDGSISCGTLCSTSQPYGTVVTLVPSAAAGSLFAGWSGAGCGGTGNCSVNLTVASTVTATFTPTIASLTVVKTGDGVGTVTSTPAGISCGATCFKEFASGTTVTLDASSAGGSEFAGWSGACSGTGVCTVTVDEALSVTATFKLKPRTLAVRLAGSGASHGQVTSVPAGITCPGTCSTSFGSGSTVTLTASVPATSANVVFVGWSDTDCGTSPDCKLTMSGDTTITASFAIRPDTTITRAPPAATNNTTLIFEFASDVDGSTFVCALNGTIPQPCASPKSYTGGNGISYSFQVHAVSPEGIADPSPATASTATTSSPLLRYKLDSSLASSGAISSTAFTGAASGHSFVSGKIGSAIRFDGSAGAGAIFSNMNSVFNTTSPDWTIALWFRESSPGQAYSGLFDIRTANQGWQTYHGAYTPITDVTTCAASGAGCGSFVNPVFGDWHSLIYRYDGTAYTIGAGAGGRLEVFVDGILALTLNSGNNPAVLLGQEVTAFAVGRFLSDSSPFSSSFDIDDIHVYNRVFTAQEQCTLIIGGAMGSAGNCKLP